MNNVPMRIAGGYVDLFDCLPDSFAKPGLLSQSATLGVFGKTGSGKTTLLKRLIERAICQGMPVVGLVSVRPNIWQNDPLKDLPGQCFNLANSGSATEAYKLYQAAIETASANPRSLLFIDEVGAVISCIGPIVVQQLVNLCAYGTKYGISLILTAQTGCTFSRKMLAYLSIRLIGQIEPTQIELIGRDLEIPLDVVQQCGSEDFNQKADQTFWLFDHYDRSRKENRSFSVCHYAA